MDAFDSIIRSGGGTAGIAAAIEASKGISSPLPFATIRG
jgi:hypothetical protein